MVAHLTSLGYQLQQDITVEIRILWISHCKTFLLLTSMGLVAKTSSKYLPVEGLKMLPRSSLTTIRANSIFQLSLQVSWKSAQILLKNRVGKLRKIKSNLWKIILETTVSKGQAPISIEIILVKEETLEKRKEEVWVHKGRVSPASRPFKEDLSTQALLAPLTWINMAPAVRMGQVLSVHQTKIQM